MEQQEQFKGKEMFEKVEIKSVDYLPKEGGTFFFVDRNKYKVARDFNPVYSNPDYFVQTYSHWLRPISPIAEQKEMDWEELAKEFDKENEGERFSGVGYNAGGSYSYANTDEIFTWLKEKLTPKHQNIE